MSRIDLLIDTHVFYAFLKFKTKILADERDKKKFLDCMVPPGAVRKLWIFAFVLLDDEAHFLVGMSEKDPELVKRTVHGIVERCGNICFPQAEERTASREENCRGLMRTEEVLAACRQIHMLPERQGYVRSLRDYWWSSYQTYRGIYVWECVDALPLLHHLSSDTEEGRKMLLRFHRKAKE